MKPGIENGLDLVTDSKPSLFEKFKPYLIILPAFILTIGILVPFATGVYWSLTNYNLMYPNYSFIGITNYIDLFTSSDFWHALKVSGLYVLFAVGVEVLLGLAIALLLNRDTILAKILRPMLIFPLLIAPVVGTLMWKLMMSPEYGVLNYFLSLINPALRDFPWAASSKFALLSVVIVDVWIFTPFIALLLLAGLRSLPAPPFEAAKVDGASNWFIFKNLTMPMLTPYLVVAVIFRLVDSIRMFDIPFAMTKGGPGDALMNLQITAFTESFTYLNLAVGCAYMFVTWIIIYFISKKMINYWLKWRARLS
ncbi:carbohydrate ABC transporter permease [Halothermothrix orenii]|uniref:Binding-protein-dependent transport systems inner membrane component n=1 Tax=Halothermothrix orenii (strain H 168 / OCM 544 / DSM 9562) TaxID=373903 RepID=B8D1L4_HALOH|nr:sugar ABC transporter permease [Halothermothrix orenii]ACL69091.1 binding-protein-dependent transport systems inner membrane component [Halothermothrix orenii H 168]